MASKNVYRYTVWVEAVDQLDADEQIESIRPLEYDFVDPDEDLEERNW